MNNTVTGIQAVWSRSPQIKRRLQCSYEHRLLTPVKGTIPGSTNCCFRLMSLNMVEVDGILRMWVRRQRPEPWNYLFTIGKFGLTEDALDFQKKQDEVHHICRARFIIRRCRPIEPQILLRNRSQICNPTSPRIPACFTRPMPHQAPSQKPLAVFGLPHDKQVPFSEGIP
jgi:hypothetical protein